MATCIGLLRAINLGAHNKIRMADLKAMLERLGFAAAERQHRLQ
jgi:uncharacterized protein (DUF1697 family)